VTLLVFVHSHTSGDVVLGFKGGVSHHREDVKDIVRQTGSAVVGILTIVVHLKFTA
jgi:hypothetical protein